MRSGIRKLSIVLSLIFASTIEGGAQVVHADNTIAHSYSREKLARGAGVYGVFEGRFPCKEIAAQYKITVGEECTKVKWGITFYQDSITKAPTTYKLEGGFFRPNGRVGKWTIIKDSQSDPYATIFQLDPDKPSESFFFQKGDDNVLFILDQQRKLRVGNIDLSYTLNRSIN